MPKTTKCGKPKEYELPSTLLRSDEKAQRTFAKAYDSAAERLRRRAAGQRGRVVRGQAQLREGRRPLGDEGGRAQGSRATSRPSRAAGQGRDQGRRRRQRHEEPPDGGRQAARRLRALHDEEEQLVDAIQKASDQEDRAAPRKRRSGASSAPGMRMSSVCRLVEVADAVAGHRDALLDHRAARAARPTPAPDAGRELERLDGVHVHRVVARPRGRRPAGPTGRSPDRRRVRDSRRVGVDLAVDVLGRGGRARGGEHLVAGAAGTSAPMVRSCRRWAVAMASRSPAGGAVSPGRRT